MFTWCTFNDAQLSSNERAYDTEKEREREKRIANDKIIRSLASPAGERSGWTLDLLQHLLLASESQYSCESQLTLLCDTRASGQMGMHLPGKRDDNDGAEGTLNECILLHGITQRKKLWWSHKKGHKGRKRNERVTICKCKSRVLQVTHDEW